ncbi:MULTISPECIES: bifunctional riboflavin kinase/FAD synthetase [Acetobacter]|uniref:Riboflavin biosynthesis protein n=1 Tax=Acetobacter thailandicus TaxID=1502842 RepID=A0ABT3QES7_9PROT|nr:MULTISPECIES: bifunctional riboflavin kinase/FAD synthetase [Acetobacter]MBS0959922.1 bifunctional riboflavin kinase/FAD synthetase [Acetobacter thailandicus]MBS0979251.1 bifunctional riboflavin kinase/FAD synthetase [Acetobacter thailandicus]MBS0985743.1 bifunctional riboflavin kinase/FAD synthetase [Acetobacter thailandicus]MBS1002369.1 bifunctional riboflavin kinase/FAD synthetase [Acetobacter thailandicus]MCX2563779.1 bifunctional riboflavin kinase/FAD synthetase [Acetobacter thailandic
MTARLHKDWKSVPDEVRGCAAALGNFDGVHRGHAHLVRTLHSARPDLPLAVVAFEPHPGELFRPTEPPFRLTLSAERLAALSALGVKHVFQIRFDEAFSHMPAERFAEDVLSEALGLKHVACGADFCFGFKRSGNAEFLAERCGELNMGFIAVSALTDEAGPYSSTRIRKLLKAGQPERAAEELGRLWSVHGVVQHGAKRGRLLGFPTANIALGRHLEPARGVYAVTVRLTNGSAYAGVANIGIRPTIDDGLESRLEVHLFDYEGDLYGQEVSVALHRMLRPEKRFDGLDALRQQITRDADEARQVIDQERGSL